MSREALVLLVCCCDFRDGAERLIPSKSLRNAVIRAFPGLFCILRMCAPRRAAAVVRPRGREKSADRRRRIPISRLLIIRASVPRRKSPFPAYFRGFPAVSLLIPPYPAFLKYPVSPQLAYMGKGVLRKAQSCERSVGLCDVSPDLRRGADHIKGYFHGIAPFKYRGYRKAWSDTRNSSASWYRTAGQRSASVPGGAVWDRRWGSSCPEH